MSTLELIETMKIRCELPSYDARILFRYKKRFMEIYRKLAKYKQLSTDLNRRTDKRFKFEESEHQEINVKISKFVNRTKEFPDFLDIKKLVSDVNMKNKLGLVEAQVFR